MPGNEIKSLELECYKVKPKIVLGIIRPKVSISIKGFGLFRQLHFITSVCILQ